jgi:hypothetical protein
MLKPPDPFELPEDNDVDVILESVFFKTFGLPGWEGKYPSPAVIGVGGVLALEVFGDVIVASGL